jgi:hypothetical protein
VTPRRAPFLVAAALVFAGAGDARGQFAFGQNKIHYRGFDWQVLRGEHVDLYHYPEADELARVTLAYAEESYRALEQRFSHAVPRRIPFIVYASHADFEQTNILPFVPPEGLLGVTEFAKRRVALPFRGNYAEFRHTIRHELVHVFQLSLGEESALRYPKLRMWGLPLWWTEGLAEYFSAGEDTRDEMVRATHPVRTAPHALRADVSGTGHRHPMGGAITASWRRPTGSGASCRCTASAGSTRTSSSPSRQSTGGRSSGSPRNGSTGCGNATTRW